MPFDLSWLPGRLLQSVEKKDFTWFFVLDDSTRLLTESLWRLTRDKVLVTSEDEGHPFGLPTPVNAAQVVADEVGKSRVARFDLDARSGDLSLHFDNGVTIQFVTQSGGYEGWRIHHGNQQI